MPHTDELYPWRTRVQALFPKLLEHHRRSLADYSFAAALSHCIGLTSVVAYLAGFLATGLHALTARLRELYLPAKAQKGAARSEFESSDCFAPLTQWAANGHAEKRLVLALDPTCLTDRFRVLCVTALYQGIGLPIAWRVQTADEKGSWNAIWADLLQKVHAALGEGWDVLVLTDRGLESVALFQTITALGWHPLMRVKAAGKFQPAGWHQGYRLDRFAATVGRRWAGTGVAYPGGQKLSCTLLAAWEDGHEEAWLILTDLPAAGANPAWYAWRMWAEQGYRVGKRGQWQWQRTQMTEAARARRLWAVRAVATLWAVEVGGEGEVGQVPPLPLPKRKLSLLKVGLKRILLALLRGEALPLPSGRLPQHPWPSRDWEPDPLTEESMNQC
jgi:hypothetical protein